MASLPFQAESFLQPLSDDAPSGPDMVYEPPFAALELAGAGKPERQYGEKVYPAEPPDWVAVHEGALTLAAASRDLRVAVWLLRSGCHLHGLAGAVAGLQLLDGLLAALGSRASAAGCHPTTTTPPCG
jgi:type VI secretion system protein ImpA